MITPTMFLLEVQPFNTVTKTRSTFYFSQAGKEFTGNGDRVYLPFLTRLPEVDITLQADNGFPQFEIAYGSFGFRLPPGLQLIGGITPQQFKDLDWDGAPFLLSMGAPNAAHDTFTPFLRGSTGPFTAETGLTASLAVRGPEALLDKDVLTSSYTGAGLSEGSEGLRGVLKPWCSGPARNVRPILIDAEYQIYQYHGYGATEAVLGVYENAVPVAASPASTVTTYTALRALTLAEGQWAAAPAVGMFRLGGEPMGDVTCDVIGAVDGASTPRRTGAIVSHLLRSRAGIAGGDIATSSFTALDTDFPYDTAGLYLTEQVKVFDLVTSLINGLNGYLFCTPQGQWTVGRNFSTKAPITLSSERNSQPLVRDPKTLQSASRCWEVRVGGATNWTLQNNVTNFITDISSLATNATNLANAAQADVNAIETRVDAFSADGLLDPTEKKQLILDVAEWTGERAVQEARADSLGITTEKTAYQNALDTLIAYLNGLSPLYTNLSESTSITRTTYRANINTFYNARAVLLSRISLVASQRADWANVTGSGKPENNATNTAPANANRVPFSRFEGNQGWGTSGSFGPTPFLIDFDGRSQIAAEPIFTAAGQNVFLFNNPRFTVNEGERLSVSGRVQAFAMPGGADPNFWQFYIEFYDASNAIINNISIGSGTTGVSETVVHSGFVTVPTGARSGQVVLLFQSRAAGRGRLAFVEPMVTTASAGQTTHPPFSPGPNAQNGATVGAPAGTNVAGVPAATLVADAATAKTNAETALTTLAAIANDGILSRDEKPEVVRQWEAIAAEVTVINNRATAFGLSTGSYDTARNTLASYLNSLSPAWWNNGFDTPIVRSTFNARFNDVLLARQTLLDQIAAVASQRSLWSGVTGSGRPQDNANLTAPANSNRVPFSRMEGDRGWDVAFNSAGLAIPSRVFGQVAGIRYFYADFTATASGQVVSISSTPIAQPSFRATAGERLSIQCRIEATRNGGGGVTWGLAVWLIKPDGSRDQFYPAGFGGSGQRNLDTGILQAFFDVPAGYVSGYFELYGTSTGAGNIRLAIGEPMVTGAVAGQTVHPAFTPGPNAQDGADVTALQPIVSRLDPVSGLATSRRLLTQFMASGIIQLVDVNPLSATTDGGGASTISIAAHQLLDDAGSVSFSASSISGLSANTFYYVFEDNPLFVGGARTYQATTNRNALASPGRRFVQAITTPAIGGSPSSGAGGGAGAGPPGQWEFEP